MAESYRGLTIRIGGDTTKLTKALHAANQAVASTQGGIRKLNDALKMDPSSLKASQLQMGAFAEQASNAATRLVTLNEAMRSVGNEIKDFNGAPTTVRELADSWGNVQMRVAQAREYYANLTKTIATAHTDLSRMTSDAARDISVLNKGMVNDWTINTNVDKIVADMQVVPELFQKSDAEVAQFKKDAEDLQKEFISITNKIQGYAEAWGKARNAAKRADYSREIDKMQAQSDKLQESFKKLAESFATVKGTTFKFDNENVDMETISAAIRSLRESGLVATETLDALESKLSAAKTAFADAKSNLSLTKEVAEFSDLEKETTRAEAKVKSLVDEMVKLSNTSETAKGMVALKQELNEITSSGTTAEQRLKSILTIISKDGNENSTFLQREAMRDYAVVTEQAQAAVKNINKQLDEYDGTIRKLAASTKTYTIETNAANKNYEEAAAALKGYEGAMEEIASLQSKIETEQPDTYMDDKGYQAYEQTLAAMQVVLDGLKSAFAAAEAEKKKFVEIGEVRELTSELAKAKDRADAWAKINIKPEVDLSALEGLKKALKALEEGELDASGFTEFSKYVKDTADSLEVAEKRYKALSEAAKANPTNTETLRQRTAAFDEVIIKTIAHIDAMKAELAAIPSDQVDHAALSAGRVTEAYIMAKREADKWATSLNDLDERIKKLEKEKKSIDPIDPQAKQKTDNLNKALEELKQRRLAVAATAQAAFDHLVVEENTRRVEQNGQAIQEAEANLHRYGEEARGISGLDIAPKIDEAAFMQVVDRIAQAARQMGQHIVQSANEIDSAYRDMRKTVNGTEEDFVRLKDAAIEYSQNSITSADTMLEMQALGGQLGIVVENLEQFGRITSNLDIATDIDAENVALKLGQISNVLGLDIEGMQGFSDALVRLGNNMPAQESSIMAVAQRFGAVASTAKFSGDEILAWSAAIAATGQRSESAATAISNTVSGIEQAVANGGSDLKQFAAIAGMSADEFIDSWKKGPTEVLRGFIKGLETLKDSDESAVAALENMGITGVRQQQTLLALTQTIDSLDDALLMSKDAWNGVDDQWGQAGDAAIEAGRKSEGFSGALAILQNNAQNLAAVFGETLVPAINLASDIVEFLTDLMNAIPGPVKAAIATLGGMSVVFSALTPMAIAFGKGIGGVIATIKSTSSIAELIYNLTGIEAAAMAAAEQGVNLAGVLSGPVILGITAVVGAIAYAVVKINEYNESQKTLSEATTGLTTAVRDGKSAYEEYMSGAQNTTTSIRELKDAIDETIESQANLAREMRDAWEEIAVKEATIDTLVQKIEALSSKSSLTASEQKELAVAVDTFNNMCGASVRVLDEQSGQLDTSMGLVKEYADAWKHATENNQHVEDYGKTLRQLMADEQELEEVNRRLESGDYGASWFVDARDGANQTSTAYSDLKNEQIRLTEAVNSGKAALQESVDGMSDLGQATALLEAALAAEGDSLANYGDFTDDELRKIVNAFNNASDKSISAADRVRNAIDSMRNSAAEAASIAGDLEASSAEVLKAAAEEYKKQATADYDDLKARLNATYKAKQAEYNAEYKALQKALNNQYKAQQKAYDNEYKAQQKAFENQYNALKKQLDNEYNERKKGYDAQLKALKKSQDDEVDAYNNATDAKLKAMEREYKERLKLLELEYGGKTDSLDKQINALNAETEAEKAAIEEREEAEKTAELQRAVDQAKSRRKRADAEKALNDYLEEIQQKHSETERNAQIEALKQQQQDLKDELAERKETLKEQYDEEVTAYKDSRAAQLDAIKEANTAEYDAEKERLDGLLETLKESQTARLENVKESQTAQLEALKENQQAQLEAMKDGQQAQLDAMKSSQTTALENLKAANDKQLSDLKAAQDAKYNAIKNGEDAQTNEQKSAADTRNKNLENADKTMLTTHERYLTGMERRMQEMGDRNIRSMDSSSTEVNNRADRKLTELDSIYGHYGEQVPESFINPFSQSNIADTADMLASDVASPFNRLPSEMYVSGWDMLIEFNNGLVNAWNHGSNLKESIENVAWYIKDRLGFSVPKKGPMSDADKWGPDMVQLIADGIRDEQNTLVRRVEKMSRAVEDAFDPTLTVDAAYEALDTIGRNRKNAMGSIIENHSAAPVTINLNMDLSNVSIRSDEDIEKLAEVMSQKMAAQAARQLAGRLGR